MDAVSFDNLKILRSPLYPKEREQLLRNRLLSELRFAYKEGCFSDYYSFGLWSGAEKNLQITGGESWNSDLLGFWEQTIKDLASQELGDFEFIDKDSPLSGRVEHRVLVTWLHPDVGDDTTSLFNPTGYLDPRRHPRRSFSGVTGARRHAFVLTLRELISNSEDMGGGLYRSAPISTGDITSRINDYLSSWGFPSDKVNGQPETEFRRELEIYEYLKRCDCPGNIANYFVLSEHLLDLELPPPPSPRTPAKEDHPILWFFGEDLKAEIEAESLLNSLPEDPDFRERPSPLKSEYALRDSYLQQKFREKLLQIYRKCPVTGCPTPEMMEAAHIRPYARFGPKSFVTSNGLMLRRDIHKLFDLGWISFCPKFYTLKIAESKRNISVAEGVKLSSFEGKVLGNVRPKDSNLLWHYCNIFIGA